MKINTDFDKYIDRAFREEPTYYLPSDFSERIAEKASRKHVFRAAIIEYSLYVAVFVGLSLIVCITLYFIYGDMSTRFLSFFMGHLTEIISLAFIVNFILFADKVLLRVLFKLKQ